VLDVAGQRVRRRIDLPGGRSGMPQDVKLSPDGRWFYVADMMAGGVYQLDAATLRVRRFIRTGKGAHGLYMDRTSRRLFVTNRGEGTISLLAPDTGRVIGRWSLPGGGSPDMGGLNAAGTVLWLSGRYDRVVYAIRTSDGKLLRRIRVGDGPHGLCVWPQPGRYSLGHTGILR
jgi:DNA-binding beta-propeller fold protein YncE